MNTENTDSQREQSEDQSRPMRFFTLRALILCVLLGIGFSVLIPWNDWFLRNTYLNNHYMPLGLTLVLLIMGIVVNPILGRFRLLTGEMVLIAVVMLGLAGVTSSGLMRMLPYMIVGPSEALPSKPAYDIFAERAPAEPNSLQPGEIRHWNVPHQLWMGVPEQGVIPQSDPEYRYLVNGYLRGLPNPDDKEAQIVSHRSLVSWRDEAGTVYENQLALAGIEATARQDDPSILNLDAPGYGSLLNGVRAGRSVTTDKGTVSVLKVQLPSVPWYAWIEKLTAWAPLLLGALLACLGIAGIVRRQWIHNERLPYPIASVTYTLLEQPTKKSRFAEIFRTKAFWVGLSITGTIIAWRGLFAYDLVPVDITLSMDLYTAEDAPFAGEPWNQAYQPKFLFKPQIFFSIVALTFFLALDLSFSLWFFFILSNVVFLVLRQSGVPISNNHMSQAGVGGFAAECILILWIGRKYYWQVVKAAIGLSSDADSKAAAPYLWVLLGGCACMVAFFTLLGTSISLSILMVLLFLGFFLVLARIVAEAGIPYIGVPTGTFLNSVFFSIAGFGMPVALVMPLSVVGMTLLADSREAMLPYFVNADYMADKSKAPRKRMSLVLGASTVVAVIISMGAMVYFSYTGDGHPDGYGGHVLNSELSVISQGFQNAEDPQSQEIQASNRIETLSSYFVGSLFVLLLGAARLMFSWWPFHPIGYLASMTYATWSIWFSFFLGWLFKAVVMRYGGTGLYKSLKPFAIGLIAGEALAGGCFMLVKIIAFVTGQQLIDFKFLPG